MDRFEHEIRRYSRFEGAVVAAINGDATTNSKTGDRLYARDETQNGSQLQPKVNDRQLLLCAGDYDVSTCIGNDPWVT